MPHFGIPALADAAVPFLVVFDPSRVELARGLAHGLALPSNCVFDIEDGGLAARPRLLVDIDLTDTRSVDRFRQAMGTPPTRRDWLFIVARTDARHQTQTQANALNASRNIVRSEARPALLRMMSVAGQRDGSRAAVEALLAAPGGRSIHAAGEELAGLFSSFSDARPFSLQAVHAVGTELIGSIGDTGAANWLDTVRGHHEGTFQHCLLVAGVAAAYAARHLRGTRMARRLTDAALLHDIGKACVPLHVLDKPGRLDATELDLVRAHPRAAVDYLASTPGVEPEVLDAVLHHHEALDGSGYPDGLRGSGITPLTRILTVCDIFAALVERRAYKPPLSDEDAIAVLVDGALDGKVDYIRVRSLAEVFGMNLPATLDDVRANMAQAGAA